MNQVVANGLLLVTGLALGGTALAQLQTTSSQYWHQGSPGVGIQPEEDAEFGRGLLPYAAKRTTELSTEEKQSGEKQSGTPIK